jgi:hypothetical protein
MKVAGILAVILAVVVGIWAGVDYAQNEQDRQSEVRRMQWSITCCDSVFNDAEMAVNADESKERFDAIMGIVAAVALIGGIALVSQRKKSAVSVNS